MANISLKDLVDEIMIEATEPDSLFRNKSRFMALKFAKIGLQKLDLAFSENINGMNVKIPESCKVQKPEDYNQFIRAYIVNCDSRTIEIAQNSSMPSELYHYLVNCDGSLVKDCDGDALKDDCIQCTSVEGTIANPHCKMCCGTGKYEPFWVKQLLKDINDYKDEWIKVKDKLDYFEFSSGLEGVTVVIEYLSSTAFTKSECDILIPDKHTDALEYYIKYRLLETGQDTIQMAKYFEQKYKNKKTAITESGNSLTMDSLRRILLNR